MAGMPSELMDALIAQGARDLTIVSNNAGNGDTGLAALLKTKRVKKIICSFPRQTDSYVFDALYRAGEIALEVVPQGTLVDRMRAAPGEPGSDSVAGAGVLARLPEPVDRREAARQRLAGRAGRVVERVRAVPEGRIQLGQGARGHPAICVRRDVLFAEIIQRLSG